MKTILALSQAYNWIAVAVLVLALVFIARILSRRKDRKNWLIFVLLGLRGCGIDIS